MIAIARRDVPGVDFQVGDFNALPFEDGAFDAVISSHALLFADDRTAALREWRRVSRSGGRLSLSVPGPEDRTPGTLYAEVYRVHGVARTFDYPEAAELADGRAMPDGPMRSSIRIHPSPFACPMPDAFAIWRRTGSRGAATAGWSEEQHAALTADMLAVTPRQPDGAYAIRSGRSTSPRGTEPAGGSSRLAGVLHAGSREGQHRAHCVIVHPIRIRRQVELRILGHQPPDRPRSRRCRRRSGHRSAAGDRARWTTGTPGRAEHHAPSGSAPAGA